MDGFKSSQKMQCFKEGGAVKYKSRHSEKSEMSKDIAQDKKVVKKAFAMHDKQSHEGEKTDLKKLNNGGRMKKEGGCVGRYQAGGSIKMKKDATDIKDIQKIKLTKTKKAAAPSKAAIKPAMSNIAEPAMSADMGMTPPPMMKKGGKIKKYADGRMVGQGAISDTERMRLANRAKNRAMLSPMQQQELDAQEAAAAAATQKDGMVSDSERGLLGKLIGRKNGGKAKAC
jgi:hypothetical protein